MRYLIALIALAACTRAEDKTPTKSPAPTPPGPMPLPTDDATTSQLVLVQAHDGRSASGDFLFAELAADPKVAPKLHLLGKRSLHGTPGRQQHHALASHDGNRWARVAAAGEIVVEASLAGPMAGKAAYTIKLGALDPRAIHLVGDALYVGLDKSVCWIDTSMSRPDAPCTELARRDHAFKSYDLFVHRGDRVLAIDDEVSPMYADWFAVDGHGKPVKRAGDWKLPDVINGLYTYAALGADALFLVAPYGILSGSGHDLVAVPIKSDKLVFDPSLTIQNPDGKTPILEEHVSRGGGRHPTKLLAGTAYSPITGLAVAPDAGRLLAAVGPRGLLSISVDFKDTTSIDLSAPVTDVLVRSKRVLVLAGRDLITLDGKTLAPVDRTTLPTTFDRFVR